MLRRWCRDELDARGRSKIRNLFCLTSLTPSNASDFPFGDWAILPFTKFPLNLQKLANWEASLSLKISSKRSASTNSNWKQLEETFPALQAWWTRIWIFQAAENCISIGAASRMSAWVGHCRRGKKLQPDSRRREFVNYWKLRKNFVVRGPRTYLIAKASSHRLARKSFCLDFIHI